MLNKFYRLVTNYQKRNSEDSSNNPNIYLYNIAFTNFLDYNTDTPSCNSFEITTNGNNKFHIVQNATWQLENRRYSFYKSLMNVFLKRSTP